MRELLRQLLSYLGIGLVNTVLSVTLILVLLAAGVAYALANLAGYGFGLLFGFSLNRRLTFRSAEAVHRQLPAYLGVYGGAFIIQLGITEAIQAQGISSPSQATFAGAVLFALLNFGGNRLLVFRN